MSERVWYYVEGDAQQGPVTRDELLALLRRLPPDTLVWREGLADWQAAQDVAELGVRPSPPPPPPPPPPMRRAPAPPRAAVRPSYAPAAAAARLDEPPSYNPFVLWRRCFSWSGRFDRGEFAIAYFGQMVVTSALFIGVGVVNALLSAQARAGQDVGPMLAGAAALLILPFTFLIAFGSAIRRLHDMGQSGWLSLLLLLPCLNFLFAIYLVVAPSQLPATGVAPAPGGGTPIAIVVAVVAAVLFVPILGIVAAIAIPSLLRARVSANEAGAIGDTRAVISAAAAYQSANGGFYGNITCLATPSGCIAGYNGSGFLDATLAQPQVTLRGYERRWFETPSRARTGAIENFCYSATPAQQNQTGVRSFGGDGSGMIVFSPVGVPCCSERGLDLSGCQPLR